MAITKERLQELIEQEATVWYISHKYVNSLWLFKDNNYIGLDNMYLYENKEDAEFVAKYHTSRLDVFEPPTYEEFLKLNNQSVCWDFLTKDNQQNFILIDDMNVGNDTLKPKEEWTVVVQDEYDDYIFEEPLTKENYYKAVELARKLFLGEIDEN